MVTGQLRNMIEMFYNTDLKTLKADNINNLQFLRFRDKH